jgi:Cu2+-exporting ATPase
MLLFFLLAGRALDHAMRRKVRAATANLAALRMPIATRIEPGGGLSQIPVAALNKNDVILVRRGERFPADGAVLRGESEVDESLVTGETERRIVAPQDLVYAGTLCFSNELTVAVMAASSGTLLDEIERLVNASMFAKARYLRLADRVARFYAPVVHITALTTAVVWLCLGSSVHDAVITGIAVLIITCPCALALAVPTAQATATGSLFRAGVLATAGDTIERLAEANMVVFDKTGTLTLPELSVVNHPDCDPTLLRKAARLARASRHPLAQALASCEPDAAAIEIAEEQAGSGLMGKKRAWEAQVFVTSKRKLERAKKVNRKPPSSLSGMAINRPCISSAKLCVRMRLQRSRPCAGSVWKWRFFQGIALSQ